MIHCLCIRCNCHRKVRINSLLQKLSIQDLESIPLQLKNNTLISNMKMKNIQTLDLTLKVLNSVRSARF